MFVKLHLADPTKRCQTIKYSSDTNTFWSLKLTKYVFITFYSLKIYLSAQLIKKIKWRPFNISEITIGLTETCKSFHMQNTMIENLMNIPVNKKNISGIFFFIIICHLWRLRIELDTPILPESIKKKYVSNVKVFLKNW